MGKMKTAVITVRVPPALHDALRRAAKDDDRTACDKATVIVARWLREHPDPRDGNPYLIDEEGG